MWRKLASFTLLATSLLILVSLSLPGRSSADVNDFTVTNFTADYYLTHGDPQGALDIDEHISVNFTDFNHGILRALPERYNGESLHLKIKSVSMNGSAEHYTTSTQNGNLVLKIGDASRTFTGAQKYEIRYHVVNVIRFTNDRDELDWNTNGTQWQQPFSSVTAKLHLPPDINPIGDASPECATGAQGSVDSACTITLSKEDGYVIQATEPLGAEENMTIIAKLPKGTFTPPTWRDRVGDYAPILIKLLALPLIVFIFAYSYWYKNGRDLKGRGTIVPEYGPPKGLSPLEVDTIAHYKLGTKAISATLIDLAIRKYIRIIEASKDKLLGLGKTKVYNLELLTTDLSQLNDYERQILDAVFGGELKTVEMSSLKNKFYKTAQSLQKQVPADLTKAGYFPRNPTSISAPLLTVAAVLVFGCFYLFSVNWQLAISGILSGAILFLFAALMPKRSQQGVDAKDDIDGLKLYMEVAEKDRIKMLQSPDAPYATKSDAPEQTVELFEKLLPYAIILGVEGQWAKKFESIYTTPPDWYSGNWTAFNTGLLVGSLNSSMGAMTTSFSAPSSSGSGSGGGFSGGGGGGGGGGGW